MAIATRRQDAPAWLADGDVNMSVFKSFALGGKNVEVRSKAGNFTAITTKRIAMKVVSREKQDIELPPFQSSCLSELMSGEEASGTDSQVLDKITSIHYGPPNLSINSFVVTS
jgi:hypothetical protein